MRPSLLVVSLGSAVLAVACAGDPGSGGPDAGPAPRATWYQDIAPMLSAHCMGCHRDGGIAPFSLETYASAKDHASVALFAVETGYMPPFDAEGTDTCAPRLGWKHDPRLTGDEVARFRAWMDDGYAEGEPAAVPPPPSTEMAGVTHSVTPTVGHATSGDADEFICYLLDPQTTQATYMTGLQVRPGLPEVVHHAVLLVVPPGQLLDDAKAAVGVGQPFACDGSVATLPGTYLLGVWTPGTQPMETPSDVAIPVLAGSAVVMQIHYHPGGRSHDPDRTTVDLRLSTERPAKFYTIGAWGNAGAAPALLPGPDDDGGPPIFKIPAGAADHEESMQFQISVAGGGRFPLLAAYPHMHYVGTSLEVRVDRATPGPGEATDECLIGVPRWDFDWQRTYQYDAPIDQLPTVGDGDTISVHCTYDNTLDNPYVQRGLAEQGLTAPVDVYLGEETLDEMCLGIFHVVYDPPAARVEDDGVLPAPPFELTRTR
ncbi:MAG: hypothetical protein H6708_29785 [Kofleriaceae bacterium]|nr:hypothetical protein [Myxococcales bacterium]MCB9564596.1 hypothetical protein [Kofleriaceae bacterium]